MDDFRMFTSLNNPQSEVQGIISKKEFQKQYLVSNYMLRLIIFQYVNNEWFKTRPQFKEAFNRILLLNAISTFVQYQFVGRFMRKATIEELKSFHKKMLEENMIKPEHKNKPSEQMKSQINEFWNEREKQVLMMKFYLKMKEDSRIIYNDELEQDLIKQYVDGKFNINEMRNQGNKLWLMKFNDHIVSMSQAEEDLLKFLLLNASDDENRKYNVDPAYRKKMRTLFVQNFFNIYLLNFYAKDKNFYANTEYRKLIDFLYSVQVSQTFVFIMYRPHAKAPTAADIKQFYNRYKEQMFKNVTLEQAKDYIKNRINFEMLQRYQQKLVESLKSRYRFSLNEEAFR